MVHSELESIRDTAYWCAACVRGLEYHNAIDAIDAVQHNAIYSIAQLHCAEYEQMWALSWAVGRRVPRPSSVEAAYIATLCPLDHNAID